MLAFNSDWQYFLFQTTILPKIWFDTNSQENFEGLLEPASRIRNFFISNFSFEIFQYHFSPLSKLQQLWPTTQIQFKVIILLQ